MKSSHRPGEYRGLDLLVNRVLDRTRETGRWGEEPSDSEKPVRSPFHRLTRSGYDLPPAPVLNLHSLIRFQARVRGALARAETQRKADMKHSAILLLRTGKRVKKGELAWISVLQYPKTEDWVIHMEEISGIWRLEAKIGPHHSWRLFDLCSVISGIELTSDNQMVFNAVERQCNVLSDLIQESAPTVYCKKTAKVSGKSYVVTARVERSGVIIGLEGANREKVKPLVWSPAGFAEFSEKRLQEELDVLAPRLVLLNKKLQLGTPREPQRGHLSLKLTTKVSSSDIQLIVSGRRRIKGRWFALSLTQKIVPRLNTLLEIYELEAKADHPVDVYLTKEYQLSEILGKLNLWSAGEIREMGEELLDHVQVEGKKIDLTREKTGYTATKQELLTVAKTLNNKFDYELVFLYDVAFPTNLTIEAHPLDNSPPVEHKLDLDLNVVRDQIQLSTGKLTNEDLGKIVDMINLQDGELALLQPSSAAPVLTVAIKENQHSENSSDASHTRRITSEDEPDQMIFNEFQLRGIVRMQAYFRMKLAQRSWEPIKNPLCNLLYRKAKTVKGTSYLISVVRARGGLHLEAFRLRDKRLMTKDISHPAAYAFGFSKIEDLKLLVDSLTEFEGKLGLRKGKKPGGSVSSINISELDVSCFRDVEDEKNNAAERITRMMRRNLYRSRFRKAIETASRKLLLCKKKDIGDGVNLISIFQDENDLILEICDPTRTEGKPWHLQRMKLDLSNLADGSPSLELILDNIKMVDGTIIAPSFTDLNLPSPCDRIETEPEPTEIRNQLLTRVKDFDGEKVVVTATLVLKLPPHSKAIPTDDLEFETIPSIGDSPTKAIISIQDAGILLGLPLNSVIPIAHLAISKLLRVRENQLEIDWEVPSPVIDMEKLTSSITAIARGFLVRAKYRESLKQLKSYLVAMTEMKFFDEPFVVYAYHLEDKYKIEAVHRRHKYAIMLLIDEGLIRRFKFSTTRKKVFEEAVFPRLYMIEENDMYRLCLNPHMSSEKPSIRSLRSSRMTDFDVTVVHKRAGSSYFLEDEKSEEMPIPHKVENAQKPDIIARNENEGKIDKWEITEKHEENHTEKTPISTKAAEPTAKIEPKRLEKPQIILKTDLTKPEKPPIPAKIPPPKLETPSKFDLPKPEPLKFDRPQKIDVSKAEQPMIIPSSDSIPKVEFISKHDSALSSIKLDRSEPTSRNDSLLKSEPSKAEIIVKPESAPKPVVAHIQKPESVLKMELFPKGEMSVSKEAAGARIDPAGKYELLPRPELPRKNSRKSLNFAGVLEEKAFKDSDSDLRATSIASTKPQFSISKLSQSDRVASKPPIFPGKTISIDPVFRLQPSPEPQSYPLPAVESRKKMIKDEFLIGGELASRGNSVPTDDIRRIRRIQAKSRPHESVFSSVIGLKETQSMTNIHKEAEEERRKREWKLMDLVGINTKAKTVANTPLFVKSVVPQLLTTPMRSASTKAIRTAPKMFHKKKELIFKTGHHISDYFCIVSFYRLKKTTLKIEALNSQSNHLYCCKVSIDPLLTGVSLDEHCEAMLNDLRILQGADGDWKLGFSQPSKKRQTPRLVADEDVDFFVV